MTSSAQERLLAFRERSRTFLKLGYDRLAAARFVVAAPGELRGPALDIGTGKGLLAVALARRGLDVVTIDVDAQERGLRAGTENVAAIVGFSEAVSLAFEGIDPEVRRLAEPRDRLEREVTSAIRAVRVNGAGAPRVPNTSSLSFDAVDGESIVLGLDMQGICVSTGSACSTGEPEPSHVLLAMGLTREQAQGTVRLSLGRGTREQDIDATVRALAETVARLRRISSVRDVGG